MINYLPHLHHAWRETTVCHHCRNLTVVFVTRATIITEKILKIYMDNKPTYRVYTKAKTDFSLTIRNGKVILAPSLTYLILFKHMMSLLLLQISSLICLTSKKHWVKDDKFGKNIKDEEGFSSFALVQLTKYNPDELDVTVLWTNGCSLGDGLDHSPLLILCSENLMSG
ncbi:unnamed protein product [Lactuca virosa]|uniref:Uncharacterized protein n=1 Tax=Lactuca virosa TaxID=75947 RepID=A0AAU9NFL9_9ASTR|nr:unnamed protein product [Lactuca virosa]